MLDARGTSAKSLRVCASRMRKCTGDVLGAIMTCVLSVLVAEASECAERLSARTSRAKNIKVHDEVDDVYSLLLRSLTQHTRTIKMAPVATHTMTEPPRGSLKLRQPVADPEAVARNQLPGPLSNLGLIEQYPVGLLTSHLHT